MAGGLDVHKNKFVEEWGARRENLEKAFRFNRKTLPIVLTFGVAVPYLVYKGCIAEFNKQDLDEGRKPRKFL
eukprot:jgi/Mesen1/1166/ME000124S00203